ncbi:MAG: VTT domain-containing protein [Nocardioidaceae bacterium]
MTAVTPMLLGIKWMDPDWLLSQFGAEFFWVSLLIVFVECGLLFPFLPGDTLLFALGLFIATGKINVFPGGEVVDLLACLVLMVLAAVAGNAAGYEIGRRVGEPLRQHDGRVLKRRYLDQTSAFFERHGSQALVIGRFVPFVRTYVTLVAGVTRMGRRRFLVWSLVGAVLWVSLVLLAGYFLGATIPGLGQNIDKAMLVILAFSVIPVAVEWWRHRHSPTDHADRDATPDHARTETAQHPPQVTPAPDHTV